MPDGLLGRFGPDPPGLREVLLEGFDVEGVGKRAVEGVAALLEDDPPLGAQRPAQAVDGVVEAAAQLGGRGVGPEGEAYLLLGAALGIREQVEKKLAGFQD